MNFWVQKVSESSSRTHYGLLGRVSKAYLVNTINGPPPPPTHTHTHSASELMGTSTISFLTIYPNIKKLQLFPIQKCCYRFLVISVTNFDEKAQRRILKQGRAGGLRPSGVFLLRKFIHFGGNSRPLILIYIISMKIETFGLFLKYSPHHLVFFPIIIVFSFLLLSIIVFFPPSSSL